jgi:hypothetical protein
MVAVLAATTAACSAIVFGSDLERQDRVDVLEHWRDQRLISEEECHAFIDPCPSCMVMASTRGDVIRYAVERRPSVRRQWKGMEMRLQELKGLWDKHLINEQDYANKKSEILKQL